MVSCDEIVDPLRVSHCPESEGHAYDGANLRRKAGKGGKKFCGDNAESHWDKAWRSDPDQKQKCLIFYAQGAKGARKKRPGYWGKEEGGDWKAIYIHPCAYTHEDNCTKS